jgi:hypothetical protein
MFVPFLRLSRAAVQNLEIWEQNENTLCVVLIKQDSRNTNRRIFSERIKAL